VQSFIFTRAMVSTGGKNMRRSGKLIVVYALLIVLPLAVVLFPVVLVSYTIRVAFMVGWETLKVFYEGD